MSGSAPALAPPLDPTSTVSEQSQSMAAPSHPLDPASSSSSPQTTTQPPHITSQSPPTTSQEVKEDASKIAMPPVPKVHIKTLIISGQSRVLSFEPEMTIGRMKELIWSSWPSDWTDPAQPPSPSYLRIIHAGRILQDDSTLSSNNLPVSDTPALPTVVHISVRSFSVRGEDDPKKNNLGRSTSHRSHRNETNDAGGCKCVIM